MSSFLKKIEERSPILTELKWGYCVEGVKLPILLSELLPEKLGSWPLVTSCVTMPTFDHNG